MDSDAGHFEIDRLQARLDEAEDTLRAIRHGEVDALLVDGPEGQQIYTLQGADRSYRAMIEAMQQGAASLSSDGTVLYCNKSFADLVSRPHEEVIGATLTDLFPESQRTSIASILRQGRSGRSQGELTMQPARGKSRQVHVALNPLALGDSLVICVVVTDLTERKRHQDLQDTDRRKDAFLATLSHEMRTPLSAVVGWLTILRQGECNQADLREGLEVIERNTRALSRLIEDVLDVSRITTGKLRLDTKECDLAEIIRAAIQVVHPAAEGKGLVLQADIDPGLGLLWCDPSRIQQVVWNILSNAVKFTPSGNRVHVTAARTDVSAVIQVRDEGVGMSEDLVPHVFERFRQADSSTRRRVGGLGLGLSIVKQLVELHGGTVTAQSEGEGHGSTFTVSLPTQAAREKRPDEQGPLFAPNEDRRPVYGTIRLDGLRVLVVDDDPDARRLLTKVMEDAGATVMPANSAAEALGVVDGFVPDVLISDIGMPDEDGYDLIRQLRARGHTVKSLPAIALTAFAGKGYALSAKLAGFQLHVAKPLQPEELIAVVWGVTGRAG